MLRSLFLSVAGVVGSLIGLIALFLPGFILAAKGVPPAPAPAIWVRELGVTILALSVVTWLVRRQPDTPTLRAVLWGNALVHTGLLPIEIMAWHDGAITRLDGIVPNSVLHVVLAAGFGFFASTSRIRAQPHRH